MDKPLLSSSFLTIFDQAPFSIQIFSPDGRVLRVNRAYQKLWGLTDEFLNEFILKEYNILKDPLMEKNGMNKLVQKAFHGEVVEVPAFYYNPKDLGFESRAVWASGMLFPVIDKTGKLLEVVLFHNEVTKEQEEKAHKERLLNTQSLLSRITTILLSTLDYDLIIEKIASVAIPEFADGCIVDILEGERIVRLVNKHHDPEKEKFLIDLRNEFPPHIDSPQPVSRVLRSGKPELLTIVDEKVIRERTSNDRHFEILKSIGTRSHLATPMHFRGKIIGVLNWHITTDRKPFDEEDLETAMEISQRASIAIENARLYTLSQAAIREREDFISIASHELKTPLTSLNLQWEVANRIREDSPDKLLDKNVLDKLMAVSNRQLARLTRLVDDMLDISRISKGSFSLIKKTVSLNELIQDTLFKFYPQSQGLQSEILTSLQEGVSLNCDPHRIEQVINNLVSNAIKYGRGSPIEISLSSCHEWARVQIKDQGPGISLEDQKNIFGRFVRGNAQADTLGLGLGLYICKEIVEKHGGRIDVDSRPGHTVFTFDRS
jgi:signal transduction histidine kinase